jgi:hypothetical protein
LTAQFPVKSAAKQGNASKPSKTTQSVFILPEDYNKQTSAQNVLPAATLQVSSKLGLGRLDRFPFQNLVYPICVSAGIISRSRRGRAAAAISVSP